MYATQRRFFTIGGRSSRAGTGRTHSRTSVKQVNAIPTAPGSMGKQRDPTRAPLFIPMARVSQPQLKLRSPNGEWKGIDTSFSDLHGISDLVITEAESSGTSNKEASLVASQLIEACKSYFLENPIANFQNSHLSMNSGPEQDSIQNYTLKRRQWFGIVRAFYLGKDALWTPEEVHRLPIDQLYTLLSHLDAASAKHITKPQPWEDEPKECFEPLPLKTFVETLSTAMVVQAYDLEQCPTEMLVECAAFSRRYNVTFGPNSPDVCASIRACMLALCDKKEVPYRHSMSMARVVCNTSNEEDINVSVAKTSQILKCPSDLTEQAHQELLTNFVVSLAHSGKNKPFDNYAVDDLCTLLVFAAAARRANPSYFAHKSTLAHLIKEAVETVKVLLGTQQVEVQADDGYDPIKDFGNDLRLSHPDIHPHMKLRRSHTEGRYVTYMNKKVAGLLLKVYTAYLQSSEVSARYNTITNQLLELSASGERTDDTTLNANDYLNTLIVATEQYQNRLADKKLGEILKAADKALSSSISTLGSADKCVRLLECFATCRYAPENLTLLESQLFKTLLSAAEASRAATALAHIGKATVGNFHLLATAILRHAESGEVVESDAIALLHAASHSLSPLDVHSLIDRIAAQIPLPPAQALEPPLALQCAQIVAMSVIASAEADDREATHYAAKVMSYLERACEATYLSGMDLIGILSTCLSIDVDCSDAMLSSLRRVSILKGDLGGLSPMQLAAILSVVPSFDSLKDFKSELASKTATLLERTKADATSQTAAANLQAALLLVRHCPDASLRAVVLQFIIRMIVSLEGLDDTSPYGDVVEGLKAAEDILRTLGHWEQAEELYSAIHN